MKQNRKLVSVKVGDEKSNLEKMADKAVKDERFKERQDRREASKKWKNDKDRPYHGPNDIKWRNSTRVAMSAANIPFGQPLGLQMDAIENPSLSLIDLNSLGDRMVIPGVMGIKTLITAGHSDDYNSPINLAVRKSYSWIRHANSGSKNYEAADLGMYYLAVGQALALLGWLKRIYVHALNFSSTNRYLPRAILIMDGIHYDNIIRDLPHLLFLINWLSSAINSLAFPKFSYFEMCYKQFLNVYRDSESPKEQFYMYTPLRFGVYDPTYSSTGGGIDYTNNNVLPGFGGLWSFSQISLCVHTVMDVLLGDEDIGIISGDILKAYGEDRFKVEMTDIKDILEPVYSIEILEQIHNLTVENAVTLQGYMQNAGGTNTAPFIESDLMITTPTITYSMADYMLPAGAKIFIDAFGKEPTVDEVINATIFKNHLVYTATPSATPGSLDVTLTGIVHDALIATDVYITTGVTATPTRVSFGTSSEWAFGNQQNNVVPEFFKLTNFDWAPLILVYDDAIEEFMFLGDVHNITTIDSSVLTRIHEAAILSLFNFESGNF